jgi:iron complex transport system substrate-binding protein
LSGVKKTDIKVRPFFFILIITITTTVTICAQERIITAGSAITETVCALGDCDRIIASDRTSLYPTQIQQLPSIGYRSGINAEGIISLKPTLIIAEKDYVEDAVLSQIASSNIKLIIIERKNDVNDTKKLIAQIAEALGRQVEGKKLIESIEEDIADATMLLQQATSKPKVLCVYNRGAATVSMAGRETFADILKYVGADNAIKNADGYKPLNAEALIDANPEYIVMVSSGFQSIGGMEGVLKIPGVLQTTAGKKKQIISLDALMLTNFGPRVGQTVKELVLLLHPDLKAK